jgi:Methyltransferase domain
MRVPPFVADARARVRLSEIIFAESDGAFGDNLGAGALYYALVVMLRARVAVCIGSGGGFVPRLMRKAQEDVKLDNAYAYLIDANLPDLGFGHPMQAGGWLTPENDLQTSDERLIVLGMLSADAAVLFGASGVQIDYLHIDGDHSASGVLRDLEGYLPLLSPNGVITMHDLRLEAVRLAMSDIAVRHPALERIVSASDKEWCWRNQRVQYTPALRRNALVRRDRRSEGSARSGKITFVWLQITAGARCNLAVVRRSNRSIRPNEQAVAELVDDDGQNQQHSQQNHLHVGPDLHEVHTVLNEHDKKRAEHDAFNAADAAAKGNAADHAGGYRLQRDGSAEIGLARLDSRGQKQAVDRR